jgi:hypothetical protein
MGPNKRKGKKIQRSIESIRNFTRFWFDEDVNMIQLCFACLQIDVLETDRKGISNFEKVLLDEHINLSKAQVCF